MEFVLAKKGERLDTIVYNHYGTLNQDVLNRVLEANPHLLKKVKLDSFDKVYLPKIDKKNVLQTNKGKALW